MTFTLSKASVLKKMAKIALDKEIAMEKEVNASFGAKKNSDSGKAGKYLLALKSARENTKVIEDDRAIINEALRSNLDPVHIIHLINKYPKAFETKGIVDHIDHPIHVACIYHKEVVKFILEAYPECMEQENERGELPLEVFVAGKDVTSWDYGDAIDLFATCNVDFFRKMLSQNETLREQVLANKFVPYHLKHPVDVSLETRLMDQSYDDTLLIQDDDFHGIPPTSNPICSAFLCFESN
jgi:hypothetical protein